MTAPTQTSASAIARLLRRNGLVTVGTRAKYGIYVSGGHGGVSVTCSIVDSTRHEIVLADEAEPVLRDAGYTFTRRENVLNVEGKAG